MIQINPKENLGMALAASRHPFPTTPDIIRQNRRHKNHRGSGGRLLDERPETPT